MLSYTDVKQGTYIIYEGQPYYVVSTEFLRMQQRKAVVKAKLKNLISGGTIERSLQPSDSIEEAEMEKMDSRFLYESRGEYWFDELNNPKNRFSFKLEDIGESAKFLKANMPVIALNLSGKILGVELPIKGEYKVLEAPPAVKGNTAQGGTKMAIIEGGAKVNVPLFINEGDIIKVNTGTGEYIERVEKA